MKKMLLSLMLFCMAIALNAQNTWTGANSTSWSDPQNWSLNSVPGSGTNVIIPPGSTVVTNGATFATLQTLGTVNLALNGAINFSGACSLSSGTVTDWQSGFLTGGGTLTNSGIINISTVADKSIVGATTLTNLGTINHTGSGDIQMSNTTINNAASGTIELQADAGNYTFFSGQGTINNAGLIKRTLSTGVTNIDVIVNNTGTISVESGTIRLANASTTFTNGIYNTTAAGTLEWQQTITCLGTLTGTNNGAIIWAGNILVAASTTATFNFTGSSGISWNGGSLRGGGTLTNQSTLDLNTTTDKSITAATTLINTGNINITGSGDLAMSNSTLNNLLTGVIDLQAAGGDFTFFSGQGTLNNTGVIKRTSSTGVAIIGVILNNTGTINTESGTLRISNGSTSFTGGIYNTSAAAVLELQQTVTCLGTLTGLINGTMIWAGSIQVAPATTAVFNFTGPSGVSWISGNLTGGGTLINQSTLNLDTTTDKSVTGATTLNNSGTINITASGDLAMSNSTLNNLPTGVIDLQADAGDFTFFSGQGTLNNTGVIKRTSSTGVATIGVILNNAGTIDTESGTLIISNSSTSFTDGIYNISAAAALNLEQSVTCLGTLTGLLNGTLNWNGNVFVTASTTAIFDFTGSQPVSWNSGGLRNGGTLINRSSINLATTTNKSISGSTLQNNGIITIIAAGDLTFSNSTLNNTADGVIDFAVDSANFGLSSSSSHVLNNAGLVKKSAGSGIAAIQITLNNSGTIDVQSGTLALSSSTFNNNLSGVTKGIGTLTVPPASNFSNTGTFAPGGAPGKLTVVGNFISTASAKLAVELNGLTQITQYDHMAVQGNAIFNGTVDVTLGFAANIGDTFTIATTTGTITTFGMATTTSVDFGGMTYTFGVSVTPDNKNLVLNLTQIVLASESFNGLDAQLVLAPNPATNFIVLKNESGVKFENAQLFDLNGRLVKTILLEAVNAEIALDGLASGSYLMKINSADASVVKRLIVK